jgi:hypothetical protein
VAVDEWPDQDSFQAFMEQAQPDIGPLMEAAGGNLATERDVLARARHGGRRGLGA